MHPKTLFYIYKLIFFQLQKNKKIEESEKIFSKYLLPVHQKFSDHKTLFKKFPCLTIEAKIKIYTLKVLRNLENAKLLCKYENSNELKWEKSEDELHLQTIDLDYETIHSEILENIIFDENDSGISDFENEEDEEIKEQKIFEINKIKKIIHKSVKSLFLESDDDEFKPLIQQEKIVKEKNNLKEKNTEDKSFLLTNNNDIKTQENTDDITEDFKENENSNNKSNKILEKEKEIINYKKYNFFTDPYSNYNNFTKKYQIKNNIKKRCRDIHPFLKTFNPKFLKKENIDKKIFRRFRKFVKCLYKENKNSPIFFKNIHFWKKFYYKNLLPPVKIENNNKEIIEHKSFNTQYLIWIFNQEGTTELFKLFIKKELENILENFIKEYNLYKSNEPDIIEKLREYIIYIPEIYDLNNQKVILEDKKEIFQTTYFKEKNNSNTYTESFSSEISDLHNPFDLNFDLIGKKNFKEIPYEDNNFCEKFKVGFNFNDNFKKNDEIDNKSEMSEQLSIINYK